MPLDDLPDSPGAVMRRMIELEGEVSRLEPDWGQAASRAVRANERKKLREAQLRLSLKGTGTIPDIDARIRDSLWLEPDGVMAQREEAMATVAAKEARFGVLQTELSSLKARLDAMVRGG